MSFLVELVIAGGVNGDEFLYTSDAPEPKHRPLPSSKWQVRIFRAVVLPAAGFLFTSVANFLHRGAVGSQFIRHDDIRISKAFHQFPKEFQCRFAIPTLCNVRFQHLAFIIDGPPQVMCLAMGLSDNCEPVSVSLRKQSVCSHQVAATRSERRCGSS